MIDYILVIPSRLHSTRLPEKPLVEILGKSLIMRTYEQCAKAVDKRLIYVATDSRKIYDHCRAYGVQVLMTSEKALTGTDRVYEISNLIKAKYYINVQGDEPVINPNDIKRIIQEIDFSKKHILNGFTAITKESDFLSHSTPKVVFSPNRDLLYMSRAPIPGNKSGSFRKGWRQVCIYCFPKDALEAFSKVKKTPLEEEEDIEILRFLELGFNVKMVELSSQSIPVDLPEDIIKVENYLNKII